MRKRSFVFIMTRLPLLLSINCATYGAESEDHVLATDSGAQGITLLAVADMPTHDGLSIRGGSDRFYGEMRVTGWFEPGQDHDIFDYLSLTFEHLGDTLAPVTLFHSAEAEHITVREVAFDIPRALDVIVDTTDGAVSVADIDGSVAVHAPYEPVSVIDVTGDVALTAAGSVYLEDTGPVEVQATADVTAVLGRGGTIEAGFGDIFLRITGEGFDQFSLTTSNGDVDIRLPSGGFTLDIDAGHSRGDEDMEDIGHVTIDIGDIHVDQEGLVVDTYEVNGGGPLVIVRGAHDLEIR